VSSARKGALSKAHSKDPEKKAKLFYAAALAGRGFAYGQAQTFLK